LINPYEENQNDYIYDQKQLSKKCWLDKEFKYSAPIKKGSSKIEINNLPPHFKKLVQMEVFVSSSFNDQEF
jgi:hypothetical protein